MPRSEIGEDDEKGDTYDQSSVDAGKSVKDAVESVTFTTGRRPADPPAAIARYQVPGARAYNAAPLAAATEYSETLPYGIGRPRVDSAQTSRGHGFLQKEYGWGTGSSAFQPRPVSNAYASSAAQSTCAAARTTSPANQVGLSKQQSLQPTASSTTPTSSSTGKTTEDWKIGDVLWVPWHTHNNDSKIQPYNVQLSHTQIGPLLTKWRTAIVIRKTGESMIVLPLFSWNGVGLANKVTRSRQFEYCCVQQANQPKVEKHPTTDYTTVVLFSDDPDFELKPTSCVHLLGGYPVGYDHPAQKIGHLTTDSIDCLKHSVRKAESQADATFGKLTAKQVAETIKIGAKTAQASVRNLFMRPIKARDDIVRGF
ncbi:hypothetical protein CKM354_000417800 [Cercospora kikuchii]|uniref:DUF6590 domain-containing protein n=1 Tax=Cercospora kikuchii TaxID=84275 RepID=A0A9P3CDP1_9PEZI|nr:uncharacterized protein CKM354_000417800 [Cercospora kikuchii]GIZ40856.1 hypothetical protein CKM354_000417800 [Cercospora kikuchii]